MKRQRRVAGARQPRTPPAQESQGTLTIESIASGGEGVGRIDGLACFVPRTAPGDRAQVAYVAHARHARGRVLQLLEESAERIVPRCHHYVVDRCGGCQLQHLAEASQRSARLAIVTNALRRIGRRDVTADALAYGESWHYRGRLTLTLHRRGTGWVGGLHPHDDGSRVFALTECPISHPALVAAWLALAPIMRALPDAPRLRLGLRLVVDSTVADVDVDADIADASAVAPAVALVLEGGASWEHGAEWAARAAALHTPIRAIWWVRADGIRVLLLGDAGADVTLDPAADSSVDSVDDLAPQGRESTEALAFAQVNREMGIALRAHVLERVLAFSPARVVDGYAGIGLLAESLALRGIDAVAIESDPAATTRAQQRIGALSSDVRARVAIVTATMERGLAAALPADVVVLNPPRRGVDAALTSMLADAAVRGVRAIVYISCDPATLARDLARMPRWKIAALQCFDMFPQTAHVETVCVLVPEES